MRLIFLPLLLVSLGTIGCTGSTKRQESAEAGVYGPLPTHGAESGPSDSGNEELAGPGRTAADYGPTPVQVYPVVLVLGPGLARGYAHVGVLRALHEAKIPVGAIIGVEMGALVGAVFATSRTVNEFEWKLLKYDESVFLGSGFLNLTSIFSRTRSTSSLENELNRTFSDRTVQDAEIPLRIGIHSKSQKGFLLESRGQLAALLRVALSEPGLYNSGQWLGAEAWSASSDRPYPVEEARALSIGPVIVVDLLESEIPFEVSDNKDKEIRVRLTQARKAVGRDLSKADLVLRPALSEVGFLDYEGRTRTIFKGKSATEKNMREIKQLVGLPVDED